jgi:phospholipase C
VSRTRPLPRVRTTTRIGAWLGGAVVICLLTSSLGGIASSRAFPALASGPGGAAILSDVTPATFPIKHFVIITLENHAYDTIFGTYCQQYSYYCDNTGHGLNLNYCIPLYPNNTSVGCQKPYPFPSATTIVSDIPHGWVSSTLAYDGGKMDNFFRAEWGYPKNLTDARQTFGYYNATTAALFWDLAEQYGISENFFASNLSYSLPNHWFEQAGAAPYSAIRYLIGTSGANPASLQGNLTCNAVCLQELEYEDGEFTPNATKNATLTVDDSYLDEANVTRTFQDLFNGTKVSWTYYERPLASSYNKSLQTGNIYGFWNPDVARAETYTAPFHSHYVDRNQFAQDALAGNLSNVSWIIPTPAQSCHPIFGGVSESGNLGWCMSAVGQYIEAVEKSPEWNSTAVFVTMDEYGGFYDNSLPHSLNGSSLGFRVPLLVISPYTPEGYISHQLGYFESFLHTIEWKFGLKNLTSRDAGAPLLTGMFDTHASPRPPMALPTNFTNATYPESYQVLPLPNPATHFHASGLTATSVHLSWNEGFGGSPVNGWVLSYGGTLLHLDRTLRTYDLTGLTPSTKYRISLVSADGPNQSVSVAITVGTPLAPGAPAPPSPLAARWIPTVGFLRENREPEPRLGQSERSDGRGDGRERGPG